MSRQFRYSDPGGIEEPATLVSLSSNVRFGDFALTNGAAVGDVTNSTITLDDQSGALDLQGLRAFDFRETSAPSNNRVVFRGVVQDRVVTRSRDRSALTSTARIWSVDLSDYNWHLGKRALVDQDSNRPAESIGDRLRWLINRAAHININDYGHVTYPSRQLEANDYRLQRPIDVLNDCAIEDNYSFWVDFNEAHGRPELFFLDPSSLDYQASIACSNDPDDVDHSTVFFPDIDASLSRSASRIAFGAAVPYPNGFEYRRKDSTGQQFGKLDQVAPMTNVKSAARAGRLAQKFVNDNDEETDVLEWQMILPAEQVNDARHGQLIAVKFVHCPGYEDWVGVRILERTVIQDAALGESYYRVAFKATKPGAPASTLDAPEAPYTGSAFAGIKQVDGAFLTDAETFTFAQHGDDSDGGWYPTPVSGPLSVVQSADPFSTITTSRAMTVRIEARMITANVIIGPADMTVRLLVNGVEIDSDTRSVGGGIQNFNEIYYFNIPSYDLAEGDVVSLDYTGSRELFWTNETNGVYLRVGRGTHLWNSGTVTWVGP